MGFNSGLKGLSDWGGI